MAGAPGARPVVREGLYDAAAVEKLRAEFQAAQPYPHAKIEDLCDPDHLRGVREEIITSLSATFKETDIYKVFQTGDLANMSRLDEASLAKLPKLDELRRVVYGEAFRGFVQEVTGCGELTDRVDLSCNIHAQGCHLLCHDDVIGTRRVSFIIYLTDPDDPFTPEDGGGLELYPLEGGAADMGIPAVYPSKVVVPKWNQVCFFNVLPGKSFHAVQEVFTEKPRLAVQGWYHGPTPPEGSERATVAQLHQRSATEGDRAMSPLSLSPPAPPGPAGLTEAEVAHLARYLNPEYLTAATMDKVRRNFRLNDDSMQLAGVLRKDYARRVVAAIKRQDRADGLGDGEVPVRYSVGETEHWVAVGPPHKHRYLALRGAPAGDEAGELLWDLREGLLGHPAFAKVLAYISSAELTASRGEVRRFRPGLDYTIAHFGQLGYEGHRLDCTLCFVDDSGPMKAQTWENDNAGGFESYMEADADNKAEDAEVYRRPAKRARTDGDEDGDGAGGGEGDEDDAPLLSVSAASNTLNVVLRPPGVLRFVKYVSAAAPGSRWDVSMEFDAVAPEEASGSDAEGGWEGDGGEGDGGEGDGGGAEE